MGKLCLLLGLVTGLSSPLMADVFVEDFSDPLGDWTSGWLYLNSNIENLYVSMGTSCDPNFRGNNPYGIWISDIRGCGTWNSSQNADIDILNGFGDAATRFTVDVCTYARL